jgi:hypothetical protein
VLLIVPWGPSFWTVESAKRGTRRLDRRFDGFVARFHETFGFAPLWLDLGSRSSQPRILDLLTVVLERSSDRVLFDPPAHVEERSRVRDVKRMFLEECGSTRFPSGPLGLFPEAPEVARLSAFFEDFERLALEKAHGSIHGRRLRVFEQQLGLGDRFWCTASGAWPPVVFVYTDDQAAAVRASGIQRSWADLWYAMVKPFDEFGYISREDIEIVVDSKQNFDENYESNWRYYST